MRVFETAHDHCVLPGIYMVARIDGRCFSSLTKETHPFEAPYDVRFRDLMLQTMQHLCTCGFRVIFAYSQSDEINLLFHPDENSFSRKLRKLNSILAGEASAKFSLSFGHLASFDCRISQLPNQEAVLQYFRWRQEDAARNALNAHCYWYYRKKGMSESEAHQEILGMGNAAKHELLFAKAGINFNDLPNWQKRGFAVYFESYEKKGVNPKTGETVVSYKDRIRTDWDIPAKQEFEAFLSGFLKEFR